ncbi:hypothetical protein [Tsukamurella tyrosinosolvens]|nr:hypothetical protein [Tsukamurella tyrosinosolvens]
MLEVDDGAQGIVDELLDSGGIVARGWCRLLVGAKPSLVMMMR